MDIVERIGAWEPTPEDCEEAAAEIARLRAKVERLTALLRRCRDGGSIANYTTLAEHIDAALAADDQTRSG